MGGRFVLKASGSQYSFSLRAAGDREVILTSERYPAKASALRGIEAVRASARIDGRYQRRQSVVGHAYFVLSGAHNEVLATGETYSSVAMREAGVAAVKAAALDAIVDDETRK
jgi:uncharacterized protein YegP (UPF0339 family)